MKSKTSHVNANKESFLEKRQAVAKKANMKMCNCGGLMFDLGDKLVCGDCHKKIVFAVASYYF